MSVLTNKKVLVVEDEAIVAMMIEDFLGDLGCDVLAVVGKLPAALESAASLPIDFAVLDVNLAGEMTFPVADTLTARGIPFIFATGYGSAAQTAHYEGARTIQKPFAMGTLQKTIEAMLAKEQV